MPWNDGLEPKTPAHSLASSTARVIRSLAGPGSGKSFAIKRRIARLIEGGTDPSKILAITFTRTSAADLRKEIGSIEAEGVESVVARTVHGHAMSILMQAQVQELIQRNPRMIIDHELRAALQDLSLPGETGIAERKRLLKAYEAAWATLQIESPGFPRTEVEKAFEQELLKWLYTHNAIMIGEVIPLVLRYLANNPASPEIGRFDAILVDEYQDLNKAEQMFIKRLLGDASIVIVGDDDQSIYSFKHAHPEGIKQIEEIYGEFEDVNFETVRRCPKRVTAMASELISKNTGRSLGALIPYEDNQEGLVDIIQWDDDKQEIDGLALLIKNELKSDQVSPGDILVLAPRRLIGYKLRDKLLATGVRVKSYFRENVIKNPKVQRAYSLMYLFAYPEDKASLRYLLGFNSSDYRTRSYREASQYANDNSLTVRQALDKILLEGISVGGVSPILKEYRKVCDDLIRIKEMVIDNPSSLFMLFGASNDDTADFYELESIYQSAITANQKPDSLDEGVAREWFAGIVQEITDCIAAQAQRHQVRDAQSAPLRPG